MRSAASNGHTRVSASGTRRDRDQGVSEHRRSRDCQNRSANDGMTRAPRWAKDQIGPKKRGRDWLPDNEAERLDGNLRGRVRRPTPIVMMVGRRNRRLGIGSRAAGAIWPVTWQLLAAMTGGGVPIRVGGHGREMSRRQVAVLSMAAHHHVIAAARQHRRFGQPIGCQARDAQRGNANWPNTPHSSPP